MEMKRGKRMRNGNFNTWDKKEKMKDNKEKQKQKRIICTEGEKE